MKKGIISILLTLTLVLTACGSSPEPSVSDVKTVSSEVTEKKTEEVNTVVSNKNNENSGGGSKSDKTTNTAETEKEVSEEQTQQQPSSTETAVAPSLNTSETVESATPANPKEETAVPEKTEQYTDATTIVRVPRNPDKEASDTAQEMTEPDLNIEDGDTLSASIILPPYTIADSTNLEDHVVDQVPQAISGMYYYRIYENLNVEKSVYIVFVQQFTKMGEFRDGNVYIYVNDKEYKLEVPDRFDDWFDEEELLPDENSRYLNFSNGTVGFVKGNDTVISKTYDAYLRLTACDGELTEQDILELINYVSLYTFTYEQARASRFSEMLKN